jgi:hypothetical protein
MERNQSREIQTEQSENDRQISGFRDESCTQQASTPSGMMRDDQQKEIEMG